MRVIVPALFQCGGAPQHHCLGSCVMALVGGSVYTFIKICTLVTSKLISNLNEGMWHKYTLVEMYVKCMLVCADCMLDDRKCMLDDRKFMLDDKKCVLYDRKCMLNEKNVC